MDRQAPSNSSLLEAQGEHLIPFFAGHSPYPAIVEGKGAKVRDEEGNWYIDHEAGPGVTNIGHCHPKLISAISDQAQRLIHSPGRYVNRLQLSLAQRLSGQTGGVLEKAF